MTERLRLPALTIYLPRAGHPGGDPRRTAAEGLRPAKILGNGPFVWEEQRSGGAFLQAQPVACCSQRQRADGDAGSQAISFLRVSVLSYATSPEL